jgi:Cft2 family RNA processing exonuclease
LSFSAHTDAKGILDLVKHVAPRNVVLVHGEKLKMVLLKNKIATDLGEKFTTDYIRLVFLQGHDVEV